MGDYYLSAEKGIENEEWENRFEDSDKKSDKNNRGCLTELIGGIVISGGSMGIGYSVYQGIMYFVN